MADNEITESDEEILVCGCQVQKDLSGQGHCWQNVSAKDIDHILVEIEEQIIDGGREECADFIASNGIHYRWK